MSTKHLSEGVLLCYHDGELSHAEASLVGAHLDECAACSSRFERLRNVSMALAGYAERLADEGDGGRAEAALAEALRRQPAVARGSAWAAHWWRLAPACAALLVVGAVLVTRWPARQVPKQAPAAKSAPAVTLSNGFISLPYSDQNLSPEGAVVIEVEVPRSALLLAGAPASDAQGGGLVKAEVVVGADALARAIRFLN